jgi:hypothetical protein
MLRLLLALFVAMLLAIPAEAFAAGSPASTTSPLSPGLPQSPSALPTTAPQSTVIPTTSTSSSSSDSGLTGTNAILIAIGALVLLGGISFFIWRDARRRAPVRGRPAAASAGELGGRSGSRPRSKPRKLSPAERRRRKRGRAR